MISLIIYLNCMDDLIKELSVIQCKLENILARLCVETDGNLITDFKEIKEAINLIETLKNNIHTVS